MNSYDIPSYYNDYCIYPHDGTMSVGVVLSEMVGKEFAYFITSDSRSLVISLDKNNPLDDEKDISESDWEIINNYIYKLGGYGGILDKLQEVYNEYIDDRDTDQCIPDYKSFKKDNIKLYIGEI